MLRNGIRPDGHSFEVYVDRICDDQRVPTPYTIVEDRSHDNHTTRPAHVSGQNSCYDAESLITPPNTIDLEYGPSLSSSQDPTSFGDTV